MKTSLASALQNPEGATSQISLSSSY
jgi:hypothetical protein